MTSRVKVEQFGAGLTGQAHPEKTAPYIPQAQQAADSLFSTDRSLAFNKPPVSVHNYTNTDKPNHLINVTTLTMLDYYVK